jgi:hypothetical protein
VFVIARYFITGEDREVIKGILSMKNAPWKSPRG